MDRTDLMKAYRVFPGPSPDLGCALVYAGSRNEARALGWRTCPLPDNEYIYFNARREPEYDQWYTPGGPRVIELNSELPDGAPPFFDEEI